MKHCERDHGGLSTEYINRSNDSGKSESQTHQISGRNAQFYGFMSSSAGPAPFTLCDLGALFTFPEPQFLLSMVVTPSMTVKKIKQDNVEVPGLCKHCYRMLSLPPRDWCWQEVGVKSMDAQLLMGVLPCLMSFSPLPLCRTQWPWRVCPCLASPLRQARRRAAAKPALRFIFTTRKPYFIASKPRIAVWLRGTQITSPGFPPLLSQKGTSCHPGLWLLFSSPPVLSGSLGPQQKSRLKFPGRPQIDCGWGSGPRNEAHVAVKGVPSFLVSQCIHELCLSCSLLTVQSCYVYKSMRSLTGKCFIAKSTNHHLGLLRGHNLFAVVTSKTTGHRSPQVD